MTTAEILAAFPRLSALVIGDICLDRWCTYQPSAAEPSRETGIPRIAVVSAETTPGAGGTVANNLAALGCGHVAVLGAVGRDGFAWELREALRARGIDDELLVEATEFQTFTYTKFWNAGSGKEDLPRADFINLQPLSQTIEQRLLYTLKQQVHRFDAVLVSDQAETDSGGVVTERVRALIAELAAEYPEKVFWVDSRLRPELFRNVLAKPNEREAAEACGRLFGRVDHFALRQHIGQRPMIITHGRMGAKVLDATGATWVPTLPRENPVDICGAGDSFSAGGALTMAVTGSAVDAAVMGNLAAAVTIMKRGTGTASPKEVLQAEQA